MVAWRLGFGGVLFLFESTHLYAVATAAVAGAMVALGGSGAEELRPRKDRGDHHEGDLTTLTASEFSLFVSGSGNIGPSSFAGLRGKSRAVWGDRVDKHSHTLSSRNPYGLACLNRRRTLRTPEFRTDLHDAVGS